MPGHDTVTRRRRAVLRIAAVAVLAALPATPVYAQTVDQARFVIGLSVGRIGGTSLWDVARQPILSTLEPGQPDTFQLHRAVQPGVTVSAHGTYLVNPHFGVTGELTYLGLDTQTSCALLTDDGDASLAQACAAMSGQATSGSAIALQVGGVAWLAPGAPVQPYVKGLVGMASTPVSTVAAVTTDNDLNGAGTLAIYQDHQWSVLRPAATAAVGLATAPSQGLQLRLEVRNTWLTQSIVTGATTTQNLDPPSRSVLKSFPSVLIGIDIVLRRQRGHRY